MLLLTVVAACGGSGSGGDRADCAAAGLEPDLEPDPTLPAAVAQTEVAIVRAAVACDSDRLEELADFDLGTPRFVSLVELFDGPVVLDGETYVWPGIEENGPRTAIAADGTWRYFEGGDEGAAGRPAELVVALGIRVGVLSSDDGAIVRALAEDQVGATRVAVSPGAETVYFTRSDPDVICDQGLATQIVTVPFEGGTPQIFASGQGAVVSPDGTRIAYATGGANQCGPPNQLAVQDLGTESFSQELFEGGDATIVPLTWSPDSRRLLYSAQTPDDVEIREVEPGTGGPSRTIPVPDGAYLATYLGETGSLAVVQDDGTDARVLEIDATTGEVERPLFEVADRPAFRSLVPDPTGRHLLFTTLGGSTGGDKVSRWSDGEEPVLLLETSSGETVEDAVWVPIVSGG